MAALASYRHSALGGLCGLLLCLASSPSHATWLELHGDSAESEVRLTWVPTQAWPADVMGIDVLRAPSDSEGKAIGPWVRTTLKPIVPSVMTDREWSDAHHASLAQSLLKANLIAGASSGALKFLDDLAFRAYLTGMDDEAVKLLRGNLVHDPNVQWMLGFGTVRQRPAEEAGGLYGLFAVSQAGVRASEPIAVFKDLYVPDDDPRLSVTPTFSYAHPQGIKLTWTFPAELYEALDLRPFEVSREMVGPEGEMQIVSLGHVNIEREGDLLRCIYYDTEVDRQAPYTYHVTTRSFVARDRQRTKTEYDPEATRERETRGDPLKAPSIAETKQLANGDLALTWDFEISDEALISGFEVRRRERTRDAFVPILSGLAPSARHALDTSKKTVGVTYSYQVVALRKEDGAAYRSQIVPVLITDMRKPPTPRDLSAVVEVSEGERFVVLSWAPPEPKDTATHRWLIESDQASPGTVRRQASIGPLNAPTYRYPIETVDPRPYTFRVIALSQAGIESEPAEVSAEPPGKYLPPVVFDRFELTSAGKRLELHWRYPKELKDLKGFVLYVGGAASQKPIPLDKEARSWRSAELQPGSNHRFNVQAVSTHGRSSRLLADWTYRMPAGAGLPIKPTRLKVSAELEHKRLRVFWARVADGLTRAYEVRVKPPGGEWREAGEVKVSAPPVWLQGGVETAGTWEFEVRGATVHGLKGPAATVSYQVMPQAPSAPLTQAPEAPQPAPPEPSAPWLLWAFFGLAVLVGGGLWFRRAR